MNATFEQLEKEKKERILNAAYNEFSQKGYKDASTNVIAKNAGIGKGTLFNYFGNKEKLFLYLLDRAFTIVNEEYLTKVDTEERDFFKRLRQTTELKWQVYMDHSSALGFIANTFIHLEKLDLPADIEQKREIAEGAWGSVLTKNIDFSKFREDIPAEMSFNCIRWTMEGYRSELEAKFKMNGPVDITEESMKPYYDEFYQYLDALKKVYYKPEYQEEE